MVERRDRGGGRGEETAEVVGRSDAVVQRRRQRGFGGGITSAAVVSTVSFLFQKQPAIKGTSANANITFFMKIL